MQKISFISDKKDGNYYSSSIKRHDFSNRILSILQYSDQFLYLLGACWIAIYQL